ncbi:gustatory receptor for sugar taste 43a-like [Schistocerca gregaria]|uniref:gustatory receptor for sugar taste 43a-like n=2 Tax=Schistocerca TaxID=7008 RepID=UPI00211E923A|nr:gustatory receptor for sugar taste 43a-like [Schistocerca gregaria]
MTYGQTDPAFLSLQLMWILIHVSKLFLIVQPCSATCNEAKKTGSIVVKLLNVELQLPMKRQLEVFAMQLIHRNVEFSAFGFCNLDFPLIASIAGAVTTYLVILIQFQNSDTGSTPNNPAN